MVRGKFYWRSVLFKQFPSTKTKRWKTMKKQVPQPALQRLFGAVGSWHPTVSPLPRAQPPLWVYRLSWWDRHRALMIHGHGWLAAATKPGTFSWLSWLILEPLLTCKLQVSSPRLMFFTCQKKKRTQCQSMSGECREYNYIWIIRIPIFLLESYLEGCKHTNVDYVAHIAHRVQFHFLRAARDSTVGIPRMGDDPPHLHFCEWRWLHSLWSCV